jgi:hypothetical protein
LKDKEQPTAKRDHRFRRLEKVSLEIGFTSDKGKFEMSTNI